MKGKDENKTVAELKDDFIGFKDSVEQQITIVVMNVLNRTGFLLPRVNPNNIEQMSIEAGCDVKADAVYRVFYPLN